MAEKMVTIHRWTREGLIADMIDLYAEHGPTVLRHGMTIDRMLTYLRDEHAVLIKQDRPGAGPADLVKADQIAMLIRMAEQAIKTRTANTLTTESTP